MTILYADDNQDDIDFFDLVAQKFHDVHDCRYVHHGQQAIELLSAGLKPAIIFLDMNMPVMNGAQTLQAIRSRSEYDNVRVYILSTLLSTDRAKSLISSGASDCLTKPSDLSELYYLLKPILHS